MSLEHAALFAYHLPAAADDYMTSLDVRVFPGFAAETERARNQP